MSHIHNVSIVSRLIKSFKW